MREYMIQNQIRGYFKRKGWMTFKIPGSIYCNHGFPDLLLLRNSRACFIEVKRGSKYKISPLQEVWIKRFREAGFTAGIVKSLAEAKALMKKEEERDALDQLVCSNETPGCPGNYNGRSTLGGETPQG